MSGKWETVVNKKKSHVTKADVRRVQKKFIEGENVPKIDKQGKKHVLDIFSQISQNQIFVRMNFQI